MRPCQWLLCNQPTTGTGNKWAPPGGVLGEEGTGVRSRGSQLTAPNLKPLTV